jgi:hypothetical protein
MREGVARLMARCAAVVATTAVLSACGSDTVPTPAAFPHDSSLPAVDSASAAAAVIVDDSAPASTATYALHVIAADGHVLASATPKRRAIDLSGNTCVVARLPVTSASSRRVFFLDGDATLSYLDPDGHTGALRSLGGDATTEVAFAVAADESRIAVVSVRRASGGGYHEEVRVQSLGGSVSTTIFSRDTTVTGATQDEISWPVGWNAGSVVLADGLPLPQAGCHDPAPATGYDLADPTTGAVRIHLCTTTADAQPFGPPSAAGALCVAHDTTARPSQEVDTVQAWTGAATPFSRSLCGQAGVLSPDGGHVAGTENVATGGACGPGDGHVHVIATGGAATVTPVTGTALGWLDAHDVVVGVTGGTTILDVTAGAAHPSAATGALEAILPPDLG